MLFVPLQELFLEKIARKSHSECILVGRKSIRIEDILKAVTDESMVHQMEFLDGEL
jgi:histone H3/H4